MEQFLGHMQPGNNEDNPREGPLMTIGVVADTHVPDRARDLHPGLLPALRKARVQAILHAGDIALPRILAELEQVAPVTAVRGNRDWAFHRGLPWSRRMEFAGVPVLLAHGQGTLVNYLWDKWKFFLYGYNLERYQGTLENQSVGAKVVVFGHTHRSEKVWRDGQLWFNPGSASITSLGGRCPTFGLLAFREGAVVSAEIIELPGYVLDHRNWTPI